jgi:putative transposase
MVRRTSRIMSDPEVSAPFLENRNIFPNEDSAIRLIGALLAEFHEQWSTGKKYVDMTEYLEWRKQDPLKTPILLSVVD